jgi:hypothetical protein
MTAIVGSLTSAHVQKRTESFELLTLQRLRIVTLGSTASIITSSARRPKDPLRAYLPTLIHAANTFDLYHHGSHNCPDRLCALYHIMLTPHMHSALKLDAHMCSMLLSIRYTNMRAAIQHSFFPMTKSLSTTHKLKRERPDSYLIVIYSWSRRKYLSWSTICYDFAL